MNSGWKVAMESRRYITPLTPSHSHADIFENQSKKKKIILEKLAIKKKNGGKRYRIKTGFAWGIFRVH